MTLWNGCKLFLVQNVLWINLHVLNKHHADLWTNREEGQIRPLLLWAWAGQRCAQRKYFLSFDHYFYDKQIQLHWARKEQQFLEEESRQFNHSDSTGTEFGLGWNWAGPDNQSKHFNLWQEPLKKKLWSSHSILHFLHDLTYPELLNTSFKLVNIFPLHA